MGAATVVGPSPRANHHHLVNEELAALGEDKSGERRNWTDDGTWGERAMKAWRSGHSSVVTSCPLDGKKACTVAKEPREILGDGLQKNSRLDKLGRGPGETWRIGVQQV